MTAVRLLFRLSFLSLVLAGPLSARVWTPDEAKSLEFSRALRMAEPGSIIELSEGEFEWFFLPPEVGIRGAGVEKTYFALDPDSPSFRFRSKLGAPIEISDFSVRPKVESDSEGTVRASVWVAGPATIRNLKLSSGSLYLDGKRGVYQVSDIEIENATSSALAVEMCNADSVFERITIKGTRSGFDLEVSYDGGGTFRSLDLSEEAKGAIAIRGENTVPLFPDLDSFLRNDIQYEDGAIPHTEISELEREILSDGPMEMDSFSYREEAMSQMREEALPPQRAAARQLVEKWKDAHTTNDRANLLLDYTSDLIATIDYTLFYGSSEVDAALRSEFSHFFQTEGAQAMARFWQKLPESPTGYEDFFDSYLPEDAWDAVEAAIAELDAEVTENAFATFDAVFESNERTLPRATLAEQFICAVRAHFAQVRNNPETSSLPAAQLHAKYGEPVFERFAKLVARGDLETVAQILARLPSTDAEDLPALRAFVGLIPAELRAAAIRRSRELSQ